MASVYAADARLLAQGSEPIEGRPAVEEFWKRAIAGAGALGVRRSIHQDEVASSGDLGYQRGTVRLQIPTAEGSKTITSRYLTLWRREPDGVWRITIDISNTDIPVQSGQPAYGASLDD
jgi:ketosteroid isomerase-like protein